VLSQLIVGFVVEPFYSRVLDRAVHAFNMTIGLRMVGLGQQVFDTIGFACHVVVHWSGIDSVAVTRLRSEPDSCSVRIVWTC
jgi:hypothetical protein